MISKEAADEILQKVQAAQGNPQKVMEIIKKAGESSGLNFIELLNRVTTVQAEKKLSMGEALRVVLAEANDKP